MNELVRVKVSHLTEDALREQDEALLASLPKPKPQPVASAPVKDIPKEKPALPQLSPEEERLRDKWIRLLDMVKRGRLDSFKTFWEREAAAIGGIDAPIPDWTGERDGTILQLATHAGQEEFTRYLLEELHANPTLDVPTPSGAPAEDSAVVRAGQTQQSWPGLGGNEGRSRPG